PEPLPESQKQRFSSRNCRESKWCTHQEARGEWRVIPPEYRPRTLTAPVTRSGTGCRAADLPHSLRHRPIGPAGLEVAREHEPLGDDLQIVDVPTAALPASAKPVACRMVVEAQLHPLQIGRAHVCTPVTSGRRMPS